jgi:hypothetical protein
MSDAVVSALEAKAAEESERAAQALAREQAKADAARAAYEARSPQEKHDDEIAGHRKWIANPTAASYFWVAIKDGKVVATEWEDACDCADRAEYDPAGHTKKLSELPEAPFTLAAQPISTVQKLPSAIDLANDGHVFEILPGETPIWEHRARMIHFLDGSPFIEEDALVFGVRHADGSEDVCTIDHEGTVVRHESVEAANAHMPDTALSAALAAGQTQLPPAAN